MWSLILRRKPWANRYKIHINKVLVGKANAMSKNKGGQGDN